MGYNKVIVAGATVETFIYESHPKPTRGRPARSAQTQSDLSNIPFDGQDALREAKPRKVRTRANARRAVLAFRRLVTANFIGTDYPILASLTYADNMDSIGQGRADFNAFGRDARRAFGNGIRYICVAEFQKRGALHFHALLWGFPQGTATDERHTRVIAKLWGHGFVDLVQTDGNAIKIAGYLAKYMGKHFDDVRMASRKAYIASRNVLRPTVDKGAMMSKYFLGGGILDVPDLSTAEVLREAEYDTQWLGRCVYKQYKIVT